jgi:hypothetical protein
VNYANHSLDTANMLFVIIDLYNAVNHAIKFLPGIDRTPKECCEGSLRVRPNSVEFEATPTKAPRHWCLSALTQHRLEQSLRGSTIGLCSVQRAEYGPRGAAPAQNLGVLEAIDTDLGIVLSERRHQAIRLAEGLLRLSGACLRSLSSHCSWRGLLTMPHTVRGCPRGAPDETTSKPSRL